MNKIITEFSDRELGELIADRNKLRESAFKEIFKRFSKRIYFYCRKILGNEIQAQDIVQDTFINFLKYLDSGKKIENPSSFLFRVAKNLCINLKKSEKKYQIEFDDNIDIPGYNYQESNDLAELITASLELLPEDHRDAFCLQMYAGLTYAEIAELNNVPITTVRNWIVRAKLKMRSILTPYLENNK